MCLYVCMCVWGSWIESMENSCVSYPSLKKALNLFLFSPTTYDDYGIFIHELLCTHYTQDTYYTFFQPIITDFSPRPRPFHFPSDSK